ncbi:putative septum site-determining protein minD-like protein [Hibiscus syriacus]|uniref:Septum site-determining protein minD-like protein n=1 Tax=Hibiscus syriacus TaxID=106335 RepID=A0A6A2YSS3_HIBSY|nr:putative septum site-determining protein minD-like protein [Hibiscus syriacus]
MTSPVTTTMNTSEPKLLILKSNALSTTLPSNRNHTFLSPSFKPLLNTKTVKPLKLYPKSKHAPISSVLQWNRKPELAGETPRVVVITSRKGGIGKTTTTTTNVGLSLARLGFFVVAIDADVGPRNLDLLLGLENRVNYKVIDVLNDDCRLTKHWYETSSQDRYDQRRRYDVSFGCAEMMGLPLLGVIPDDSEVIRSINRGYLLVLNKPPTLSGLALEQAAWRLVEQDSMKAVMVEEEPKSVAFSLSLEGGSVFKELNLQRVKGFYNLSRRCKGIVIRNGGYASVLNQPFQRKTSLVFSNNNHEAIDHAISAKSGLTYPVLVDQQTNKPEQIGDEGNHPRQSWKQTHRGLYKYYPVWSPDDQEPPNQGENPNDFL